MGLARLVALVSGAVFVIVGILGFIPGISPMADMVQGMEVADAAVLGLVPVNFVANIVHVVLGAVLLYASMSTSTAILVLKVFGAAYLLLGIIGLFAPEGFGIMPLGGGEMIVHFLTAAVFLVVGFMVPGEAIDSRSTV
ncbi:MAG: DUF4383 domain-containing protein [Candidatus Limnocylindria bacterium]